MVQIIPSKPTFGQRFGQTFQPAFEKSMERFLGTEAKREEAKAKTEASSIKSLEQNKILAKFLGEDFAEFHGALGTGEQTKFFEQVMESQQRGESARKLMGKWKEQAKQPGLEKVGEEQIDIAETISPEGITDTLEEEEIGRTPAEQARRIEKQEERSFQRNKPYLENLSKIAQELPKEKLALQQMQGALDSEDFDSWRNVVAEMTGLERLKTASAQVLNSASKQFLISSLAGITGRPNQFLERSITKALISPLYAKEANQLILEGLQGLSELKEREIEIAADLEEKYTSKGREIPRTYQKMVREKLKKEALAFEKNYEARVKELLSSKDDQVVMISPEGKKGSIPKDQVPNALKKGYSRVD